MANVNKVVGAVKAGIVKRLKKLGMKGAALEAAVAAVYGDAPKKEVGELKLTSAIKKMLLAHVQANGAIVITGKTHLKVYTLKGYESTRSHGRAMAKKNSPWEHAHKGSSPGSKLPQAHPEAVVRSAEALPA